MVLKGGYGRRSVWRKPDGTVHTAISTASTTVVSHRYSSNNRSCVTVIVDQLKSFGPDHLWNIAGYKIELGQPGWHHQ